MEVFGFQLGFKRLGTAILYWARACENSFIRLIHILDGPANTSILKNFSGKLTTKRTKKKRLFSGHLKIRKNCDFQDQDIFFYKSEELVKTNPI